MLKCPPGQYFIEIATDMKLCPSIELGLGQDIIVSYVKVSLPTIFDRDCDMK